MKRILNLFLAVMLMTAVSANIPIIVEAKTINSGTCGENASWSLDDSGVLVVSGTGPIDDLTSNKDQPWYENQKDIKIVEIQNGITSIGKFSFRLCSNLNAITIPESVTNIHSWAFDDCNITDVYYNGPETQWNAISGHSNRMLANATFHFDEDTKFSLLPGFDGQELTVSFKDIDAECVLVVSAVRGNKVVWTNTKTIYPDDGWTRMIIPEPYFSQATEVKTYIWDSLDGMKPLCEGKTIKVEHEE